jgi:exonuclease SbcD
VRAPGQRIVVMGHLHARAARASESSERRLVGGLDGVPVPGLDDDEVAYVALGHLHLAQTVGAPHARYSGSPLPLSFSEVAYPHQVVLVDVPATGPARCEALLVPRSVPLVRVGGEAGVALADATAALLALPAAQPGLPAALVEVHVLLDGPEPDLRHTIDQALRDRAARVVHLRASRRGGDEALADHDAVGGAALASLEPMAVFERFWTARHGDTPLPPLVRDAFTALLHDVQTGAPAAPAAAPAGAVPAPRGTR